MGSSSLLARLLNFIKTKYNYYLVRQLVVVMAAWTAGMSLDRKLATTKNQISLGFFNTLTVLRSLRSHNYELHLLLRYLIILSKTLRNFIEKSHVCINPRKKALKSKTGFRIRIRIRINLSCWIRIRIQIADPDPGGQN
jgi:hypothetical protein